MTISTPARRLLNRSIESLPPTLAATIRKRLLLATPEPLGTLKQFVAASHATPHGAKANCYAHFLGLPPGRTKDGRMRYGGLTDRHTKAQPGERCPSSYAKTPLAFHNRTTAAQQIIQRVTCDNPSVVYYLPGPYTRLHLSMPLPRGYHLGCAIVGATDYHFLRRESIGTVLRDPILAEIMDGETKRQLHQLKRAGKRFVWSHVSGWSGGMKFVDADGKVITNPTPKTATNKNVQYMTRTDRANHNYDGLHYDHFVGLFVVKSRHARVSHNGARPVNVGAMRTRLIQRGARPRTVDNVIARFKQFKL